MRKLGRNELTLANYLMDSKLDSNDYNRSSDAYCDDLHWKLENVPIEDHDYLRSLRNKIFLLFLTYIT